MEEIDTQLSPENLDFILKEDGKSETGNTEWDRPQGSDPPLPELGKPWERLGNFPALTSHPQFQRFWKHLEP